ncbi:MAG TPA: hypothetical protein VD927_11850 [Chryseosolibacter sp.]|nr:hypothetical protein [Chryseosolibacter sp.]
MIKNIACLLVIVASAFPTSAQELYASANSNFYIPLGESAMQTFPVIHHDKDATPKFSAGGFGFGVTQFRPLFKKVFLELNAGLLKYKFWNTPMDFRDSNNQPLGVMNFATVNYSLTFSGIAHYPLTERMSVGVGAGFQIAVISRSKIRDKSEIFSRAWVNNNHYKAVMPVIPIEILYRDEKKMYYSVNYTQAVLNQLRGDLAKYKSQNFGLLSVAVGRRIN